MKTYEFQILEDRSVKVHVYDDQDRHAQAIVDVAILDAVRDSSGSDANAKLWELLTQTADRLGYVVNRMERQKQA